MSTVDFAVLYEDNQVIVAVKPQNIPTQSDSSGDESMQEIVREYVRVKYNKPGAAWLGLVHRLDRPAGGVMVFARTSKAAARLTKQIQNGTFRKTYLAVVSGDLAPGASLEDWLIKDHAANTSRRAHEGEPGAKKARLDYEVLEQAGDLSLAQIHLYTGRPHQIRVQMKLAGAPLVGDWRYGGIKAENLCLWSQRVQFDLPTRPERVTASCPPPDVWPWSLFDVERASAVTLEPLDEATDRI